MSWRNTPAPWGSHSAETHMKTRGAQSPSSSAVCQVRLLGYRRARSRGGERSESCFEGKDWASFNTKSVHVTWVKTRGKKVFLMRHLPQGTSFELTTSLSTLAPQLGQPLLLEALFSSRVTVPRTPPHTPHLELHQVPRKDLGTLSRQGHRLGQYGGSGQELTLQEGNLDVLAIDGHSSPVLQLHEAVVQRRQPHTD